MEHEMKKQGNQLQVRPTVDVMRRFIRVKAEQQRRTLVPLTDSAWHERVIIAGIEHFEKEFDLQPIADTNNTFHPKQ